MDIAAIFTAFDGMIAMERKYGTTEEGRAMIDGITVDLLAVIPYPFQISFIGLDLDESKMLALVTGIQGRIRTYVGATPSAG